MSTVESIASSVLDFASGLLDVSKKIDGIANIFEKALAQAQENVSSSGTSSASSGLAASTQPSSTTTESATQRDLLTELIGNQTFSSGSLPTISASDTSTAVAPAAVNQAAVTAALEDKGQSSNGLTIYEADPTSNAWRSENINDPALRRYLDTLPLSRESTLSVLSADDPLAAIGNIYRSMGTYATVESAGDQGGQSISIRDSEGRVLDSQYSMPDKAGEKTWTEAEANALKSKLDAYGIDLPASVDWSDFNAIAKGLNQSPPTGDFKLSPAVQFERYGFRTDPLTGGVVGGGSTSAIDYYQKMGKLPPASAVWQAV